MMRVISMMRMMRLMSMMMSMIEQDGDGQTRHEDEMAE